jgi:hypothetical protein
MVEIPQNGKDWRDGLGAMARRSDHYPFLEYGE